jgi:hypothetical protein
VSHHRNERQKHNIKIGKFFENVPNFTYLEVTITNQNFIQKEIYSTLNVMNSCYPSSQYTVSS